MPYTITVTQVKDGFTGNASDADIAAYIAMADQADECLALNTVPDAVGQRLKVLFVRHTASQQRDGGAVTSERAVSGASRSYAADQRGDSGYLDLLRQLDQTGCVYRLASNNGFVQFRTIGAAGPVRDRGPF